MILFFNTCPFPINWLTISCSYPIITTYKSALDILVLPSDSEVVAVMGVVLGSILLT